jgi:Flp pilus assembly protein TadB
MFARQLFRGSRTAAVTAQRGMASQSLHDILKNQIPGKQKAMKDLKEKYGNMSLGDVTVDQVCDYACCVVLCCAVLNTHAINYSSLLSLLMILIILIIIIIIALAIVHWRRPRREVHVLRVLSAGR